jgi:trimeric autotransporter adhesin
MSTKTTFKRIALVAVAALGFGTLSVAPSSANNAFLASFTAPSTVTVQTGTADTAVARDIGFIEVTLTGNETLSAGQQATITLARQASASSAQQTINSAFLAKLKIEAVSTAVLGGTTSVADTASNNTNFATTGWNAMNNATVETASAGGVAGHAMTVNPTSGSFTRSVGRAYLKMAALTSGEAALISTGVVTLTMTITGGSGLIQTFTQTITATAGPRTAGVATVPTTTGTIAAGGSSTFTLTKPYTAVNANDTWVEDTITLGGTAVGSTLAVTAVATGGAITLTRVDANTVRANALKSNIAGAYSVTYTIVVTAAATAAAGSTITAAGFSVTVQPYTPVYNSATVTPNQGAAGYRVAASAGGDGIAYGYASNVTGIVFTVGVQQVDQMGNNISSVAYAKTVDAVITGKGSLAAPSGANVVVKSQSFTALNGTLAGSNTINVYSDGTSGEGTLTVSVNGVAVGTYTLRFLGDAASVKATLVKAVGSSAGATSGSAGGATLVANNLATGTVVASVTPTSDPAIAVSVLDANGWAIPTAAPLVTSSNTAVVSTATRLFIDAGVSNPATEAISAGTFVQHYSYTTVASASGSTSDLTFTFVNAAGTALVSPAIKVTVGGALASAKLAFDKTSYAPGAQAILTATGLDSAGNKAFDGQNVMGKEMTSTLAFTIPTNLNLIDGSRARTVNAPMASGTWTVTAVDAAGLSYTATATVTNPAAEAKAASDAATEAATAAGDAAAEATDAANAATDAANAAAEAADAATAAAQDAADAVAALSTQVTELVSALRKQITSLTNLVIKIQRKVRA